MNLTPEQYKTLAEFAGHEVKIGPHDNLCYSLWSDEQYFRVYTPDSNHAQAFELLEQVWKKSKRGELILWDILDQINESFWNGLTLNLAICHAVLALMENES